MIPPAVGILLGALSAVAILDPIRVALNRRTSRRLTARAFARAQQEEDVL